MKKSTSIFLFAVLASALSVTPTYAQSKKDKKEKKITVTATEKKEPKQIDQTPAKNKVDENGFIQMEAGMDYKILVDAPGDVYPDYGDHMTIHLNTLAGDSVIFDTRSAMDGEPAPLQLQKSPFRGDLMEALKMMTAGDSAIVRISVDSLLAAGVPEVPWMKRNSGQKLVYNLKVISVTPKALKEQQDKENAAKQMEVDDKLIQDYLAAKKLKAQKTASGLYYTIKAPGSGPTAEAGQKVSVNYTGMLLNGEKFDSNIDPQFQHVQPFEFMLGRGSVIKGWDEGIALLKKGGKATLYIPSTLAYGPNSPSPKIPANSVLIFDVELNEIISTDSGQ